MSNAICVIGGGGHSHVVMDALRTSDVSIRGIYDDVSGDYGVPYLGAIKETINNECICAIGNLNVRSKIFKMLPLVKWRTVIHSSAIVSPSAIIKPGVFIGPRVIVNARAIIEENAIINSGTIVEHDVIIGSNTHLAPGVITCGGVHIGKNTFVGAGAIVSNRNSHGPISIGDNCFINAGSVVSKIVNSNTRIHHRS